MYRYPFILTVPPGCLKSKAVHRLLLDHAARASFLHAIPAVKEGHVRPSPPLKKDFVSLPRGFSLSASSSFSSSSSFYPLHDHAAHKETSPLLYLCSDPPKMKLGSGGGTVHAMFHYFFYCLLPPEQQWPHRASPAHHSEEKVAERPFSSSSFTASFSSVAHCPHGPSMRYSVTQDPAAVHAFLSWCSSFASLSEVSRCTPVAPMTHATRLSLPPVTEMGRTACTAHSILSAEGPQSSERHGKELSKNKPSPPKEEDEKRAPHEEEKKKRRKWEGPHWPVPAIVLHAGGCSQRLPALSAYGKWRVPVRTSFSSSPSSSSLIFTEQFRLLQYQLLPSLPLVLAQHFVVVVSCGDVLLQLPSSLIPLASAIQKALLPSTRLHPSPPHTKGEERRGSDASPLSHSEEPWRWDDANPAEWPAHGGALPDVLCFGWDVLGETSAPWRAEKESGRHDSHRMRRTAQASRTWLSSTAASLFAQHGVFVLHASSSSSLSPSAIAILQKPNADLLRAWRRRSPTPSSVPPRGDTTDKDEKEVTNHLLLDVGIWMLSKRALSVLARKSITVQETPDDMRHAIKRDPAQVRTPDPGSVPSSSSASPKVQWKPCDLFTDLFPLETFLSSSSSSSSLSPLRLFVVPLPSGTRFQHLGTTADVLRHHLAPFPRHVLPPFPHPTHATAVRMEGGRAGTSSSSPLVSSPASVCCLPAFGALPMLYATHRPPSFPSDGSLPSVSGRATQWPAKSPPLAASLPPQKKEEEERWRAFHQWWARAQRVWWARAPGEKGAGDGPSTAVPFRMTAASPPLRFRLTHHHVFSFLPPFMDVVTSNAWWYQHDGAAAAAVAPPPCASLPPFTGVEVLPVQLPLSMAWPSSSGSPPSWEANGSPSPPLRYAWALRLYTLTPPFSATPHTCGSEKAPEEGATTPLLPPHRSSPFGRHAFLSSSAALSQWLQERRLSVEMVSLRTSPAGEAPDDSKRGWEGGGAPPPLDEVEVWEAPLFPCVSRPPSSGPMARACPPPPPHRPDDEGYGRAIPLPTTPQDEKEEDAVGVAADTAIQQLGDWLVWMLCPPPLMIDDPSTARRHKKWRAWWEATRLAWISAPRLSASALQQWADVEAAMRDEAVLSDGPCGAGRAVAALPTPRTTDTGGVWPSSSVAFATEGERGEIDVRWWIARAVSRHEWLSTAWMDSVVDRIRSQAPSSFGVASPHGALERGSEQETNWIPLWCTRCMLYAEWCARMGDAWEQWGRRGPEREAEGRRSRRRSRLPFPHRPGGFAATTPSAEQLPFSPFFLEEEESERDTGLDVDHWMRYHHHTREVLRKAKHDVQMALEESLSFAWVRARDSPLDLFSRSSQSFSRRTRTSVRPSEASVDECRPSMHGTVEKMENPHQKETKEEEEETTSSLRSRRWTRTAWRTYTQQMADLFRQEEQTFFQRLAFHGFRNWLTVPFLQQAHACGALWRRVPPPPPPPQAAPCPSPLPSSTASLDSPPWRGIRVRSAVRVDLCGGWTDFPPYCFFACRGGGEPQRDKGGVPKPFFLGGKGVPVAAETTPRPPLHLPPPKPIPTAASTSFPPIPPVAAVNCRSQVLNLSVMLSSPFSSWDGDHPHPHQPPRHPVTGAVPSSPPMPSYPIDVSVYRLPYATFGSSPCIRIRSFSPLRRASQEAERRTPPEDGAEITQKKKKKKNLRRWSTTTEEETRPFSTCVLHTVDDMLAWLPASTPSSSSSSSSSVFSIPAIALLLLGWGGPSLLSPSSSSSCLFSTLEEFLSYFFNGDSVAIDMAIALPQGSGLGTSSALAGALLYALRKFWSHCRRPPAHTEAAVAASRHVGSEWVHPIFPLFPPTLPTAEEEEKEKETCASLTVLLEQLLGTGGGWQDAFGALFPGVKHLSCTVQWPPSRVPPIATTTMANEAKEAVAQCERRKRMDPHPTCPCGERDEAFSCHGEEGERASSTVLLAKGSPVGVSAPSPALATPSAARWAWPFFTIHRQPLFPCVGDAGVEGAPPPQVSVRSSVPASSSFCVPSTPWIFSLPALAPLHLLYFTGLPREGPPPSTQVATSMWLHSPLVRHALETMHRTVVPALTAVLSTPSPPPPMGRAERTMRAPLGKRRSPWVAPQEEHPPNEKESTAEEDFLTDQKEAFVPPIMPWSAYREAIWQRYGEWIQQSQALNHQIDVAHQPACRSGEEIPCATDTKAEGTCGPRDAVGCATTECHMPWRDTAAAHSPTPTRESSSMWLDALFHVIAPHVHGAKLCGAGGGGFLYMVAKSMADVHSLTQLLTPSSSFPTRATTPPCRGEKSEEETGMGKGDRLCGIPADAALFTPHPDAFFTSFTIASEKGLIWEPLEEEEKGEENGGINEGERERENDKKK